MILFVSGATRVMRETESPFLGHMITPRSGSSIAALTATGRRIVADNDCFQRLDRAAYIRMVTAWRRVIDWATVPDVVGDAQRTMARFELWHPALEYIGVPLAFVAQDGQEHLETPWDAIRCLFIGGTTAWKLGPAAAHLIRDAKARGKWVHMGRVNSVTRARYAAAIGVDSIDGSSFSRFSATYIPWMSTHLAVQQHSIEGVWH
jgi:hypothetical protein